MALSDQSGLDQRSRALDAAREATALYRQLASERPEAFTPNVADALNNLSVQLAVLGRREEALATVEEAVTLYRRLAEVR
ncbi:hypothetical protein ND748_00345, partial [Frankia sp. AiPs1]|uniref:hypothetical protein n=1 Tax=Frankia sp. AiPs1 TaxID=573493 RepID=UPI002044C12B